MRGGRKNLKKEALQGCPEPQPGQTIMQVVSLRGSNLIEWESSIEKFPTKSFCAPCPTTPFILAFCELDITISGSSKSLFYLVMDSMGSKTLALFPAKFHKSLWIKRGSYVLIEGSDREKAMEAGSKVTCMVVQVLFDESVRILRKSHHWPEGFNADKQHSVTAKNDVQHEKEQENYKSEESSDDGLPPLEANHNRRGPQQFQSLSNEEEASDSDS